VPTRAITLTRYRKKIRTNKTNNICYIYKLRGRKFGVVWVSFVNLFLLVLYITKDLLEKRVENEIINMHY
jgi:hypothetical protein